MRCVNGHASVVGAGASVRHARCDAGVLPRLCGPRAGMRPFSPIVKDEGLHMRRAGPVMRLERSGGNVLLCGARSETFSEVKSAVKTVARSAATTAAKSAQSVRCITPAGLSRNLRTDRWIPRHPPRSCRDAWSCRVRGRSRRLASQALSRVPSQGLRWLIHRSC